MRQFGRLAVALFALAISLLARTASAQVNLAWDASADPSVVGWKVSYGTSSGNYTTTIDAGSAIGPCGTGTTPCLTIANLVGASASASQTSFLAAGGGGAATVTASATQTFFFVVAAYNSSSQLSPASNEVSVIPACASWTATNNGSSWISLSNASGGVSATVIYAVAINNGAPRSGTITVAGQNFTISQGATPVT